MRKLSLLLLLIALAAPAAFAQVLTGTELILTGGPTYADGLYLWSLTSGNVTLIPYAAPPTNCSLGVNWNGTSWTCVTAAQIQAALGTQFLVVSQDYFNLGTVAVGSSASASVTLTSTGSQPVTISSLSIGGYGYSFSGATAPLSLAPQQSVTLNINFAPETKGTFTGTLVIVNNSSNNPSNGTETYVNMTAVAQ